MSPSTNDPTPPPSRQLYETLHGIAGVPGLGLVAEIDREPVAGWLRAYEWSIMQDDDARRHVERVLEAKKPTPQQVIEAHEEGKITRDEKVEMLQLLLSPEEQEQLRQRATGTNPRNGATRSLPAYRKFDD